jgi:hypothetical protein
VISIRQARGRRRRGTEDVPSFDELEKFAAVLGEALDQQDCADTESDVPEHHRAHHLAIAVVIGEAAGHPAGLVCG